jgi:hypothetical protein
MARRVAFTSGILVSGALTLAAIIGAAPAAAAPAVYSGWMVDRQPSGDVVPAAADRWSSVGTTTADHIVHVGTGHYYAYFRGYSVSDGMPIVTAIGPHFCMVWTWGSYAPNERVELYCYRNDGALHDSAFSINFVDRLSAGQPQMGYLFDENGPFSYTASGAYTYNSSGGAIHVAYVSTGHWTVRFDGLGGPGGNAQVDGYLDIDPGVASCTIPSWNGAGGNEHIQVVCLDPFGQPVNTKWNLFFTRASALRGMSTGAGAYFVANQPTTGTYTPAAATRWSSSGQSPVIHRLGVGLYRVSLPGIAGLGGSVQVAAMSTLSVRCNVVAIATTGRQQGATVRCSWFDGTAKDNEFSFVFTR